MTMPGGDDLLIRAALRDELSGPLAAIRSEIAATGREAELAGKRANIGARGFDKMAAGVGGIARTAGRAGILALKGISVAALAAGGSAAYLGIKTASSMQQAKIAFTTMLGSAQKASAFLQKLQQFAAKTPFDFPGLQTAASSLISVGIKTRDVLPIMRTLGDVTAGMGTGAQGIQRATVALQQMNAAQAIHGQDLNQLRDAGIPVYDLLSKAMGKSKKQVVELAQAGKLGKPALDQMMQALKTGKGLERFQGLMAKQSHSLAGVWSTLKDNVSLALAAAFKPAIPVMTKWIENLGKLAQRDIPLVTKAIGGFIHNASDLWHTLRNSGFDAFASQADKMVGGGGAVAGVLKRIRTTAVDLWHVFTDSVIPAVKTLAHMAKPLAFGALGALLGTLHLLAGHATITKAAIIGIVTALSIAKAATVAYNVVTKISAAVTTARVAGVALLTGTLEASTAADLASNDAKAAGIAMGIRYAAVTAAQAAKNVIVTAATGAWTAAQWLLNAALDANPIGAVILAIAALAAGLVYAYKHSETFRSIVQTVFRAVSTAIGWVIDHWKLLLTIFLPGIGLIVTHLGTLKGWFETLKRIATDAFGFIGGLFDKMIAPIKAVIRWVGNLIDKIAHLHPPNPTLWGGHHLFSNPFGDTVTPRARGAGNLAATMAAHARYAGTGGPKITNALVGGGGLGRGSGDHQAGRALDLVGSGLQRYARNVRADGGFAEMHGRGSARHLHAVPGPAGDTVRSRATATSSSSSPSVVNIAPGAIIINANGLDEAAATRVATAAVAGYIRDREERG